MKLKANIIKVETLSPHLRVTAHAYSAMWGTAVVSLDIRETEAACSAYHVGRNIEVTVKPVKRK